MLYNWTLNQTIINEISGKQFEFSIDTNPYDLTGLEDDSWVKDAIARGYLIKNTSQDASEDSEPTEPTAN